MRDEFKLINGDLVFLHATLAQIASFVMDGRINQTPAPCRNSPNITCSVAG